MESRIVKPKETHADVMARLLKKAQDEGVELLMESDSEEWFASSGTMPGVIYRVSEHGCSCRGYVAFNRCKHLSIYLERQGKRPPTAAEIESARVEWDRLQSLLRRNQLKSTGDWRTFQRAKATHERMRTLVARAGFEPQTAA